jgi:hypothetical protein
MTTLRLSYHEIMDTDFTAIDAEILHDEQQVAHYRNYDPSSLSKEIYANQSEDFTMPSVEVARQFLTSNEDYHPA